MLRKLSDNHSYASFLSQIIFPSVKGTVVIIIIGISVLAKTIVIGIFRCTRAARPKILVAGPQSLCGNTKPL